MIAKLIVHRPTREEAIITMKRALDEFRIGPISTTIPACKKILSHNMYLQNKVNTGFIEQYMNQF
jgi:acetyl-CoA carboxylase biotin carboxylase subunit